MGERQDGLKQVRVGGKAGWRKGGMEERWDGLKEVRVGKEAGLIKTSQGWERGGMD